MTTSEGSGPDSTSDRELVSRIAARDEAALAELIEKYKDRIATLAYRYLGNRGDTDLVTQDTFITVWQNAVTFRAESQVWTWLYRIAVNICFGIKRGNRLVTRNLEETVPADAASEPEQALARKGQEEIVQNALDSLPAEQRMVVVLTRFEGMTYAEAAETMNKSPQAIATLVYRARENLKAKLRPYLLRGEFSP